MNICTRKHILLSYRSHEYENTWNPSTYFCHGQQLCVINRQPSQSTAGYSFRFKNIHLLLQVKLGPSNTCLRPTGLSGLDAPKCALDFVASYTQGQ